MMHNIAAEDQRGKKAVGMRVLPVRKVSYIRMRGQPSMGKVSAESGGLTHVTKILLQHKIFKLPKTFQNAIKLLALGTFDASLRISRKYRQIMTHTLQIFRNSR